LPLPHLALRFSLQRRWQRPCRKEC
jgi:hypothetical protein